MKVIGSIIGSLEESQLISGIDPKTIVEGRTMKGSETRKTLKRGTILAKDENGNLVEMNEGCTPYCILCNDTETEKDDYPVVVYVAGHFNARACHVADGYTLTSKDVDTLRCYNIYFEDIADDDTLTSQDVDTPSGNNMDLEDAAD